MSDVITPGGIGFILACPGEVVQRTIIRAIELASGIAPAGRGNTGAIKRAYYAPAQTKAIINSSPLPVYEQLGMNPIACFAVAPIEVDDPVTSAGLAAGVFEAAGYETRVHTHIEQNLPDGFMAFVTVPTMGNFALLFWPKNPDPAAVIAFRASGDFGPWISD